MRSMRQRFGATNLNAPYWISLRKAEVEVWRYFMRETRGVLRRAARLAGLTDATFRNRAKKLRLDIPMESRVARRGWKDRPYNPIFTIQTDAVDDVGTDPMPSDAADVGDGDDTDPIPSGR